MKKALGPLWTTIRCQSLSLSSQVPTSLDRKHVNKSSFKSVNEAYLTHPETDTPPVKPLINNDKILFSFEKLEKELRLLSSQACVSKQSSESHDDAYKHEHQIVFLSKSELETAEENFMERSASLVEGSIGLCTARKPISTKTSRDRGLEWLHDNDIVFADSSCHVSNENRYIVTRKVDGTLYHNSHTERDEINNSFFCRDGQIYPPLDIFEDDALFQNCLTSAETEFGSLIEYLLRCYPAQHPQFNLRHTQIMRFLFNNPNKIGDVLTSKYFLPLLARAVYEKATDEIKKVSNMLIKSNRPTLAVIIEEILIQGSELTQKPDQKRVKNTIILPASLNSVSLQDVPKQRRNIMTVALICGIDIESIKSVNTAVGGDLVAELESEELATKLHNNGSGRVLLYEDRIFRVFPKVKSSR